jgi:hypothetical protein
VLVAVSSDRHALDEVHDEVRSGADRRSCVEYTGNIRMIHQRQCLPFCLEAGGHMSAVQAGLAELDRDQPLDRLGLLRHPHGTHAAFADLLEQLERADDRAGGFFRTVVGVGFFLPACSGARDGAGFEMSLQQQLDLVAQFVIAGAGLVQVGIPVLRSMLLYRGQENPLHFRELNAHDTALLGVSLT